MKKMPLKSINKETRKKEILNYTLVDDEDYEWLNQYSWSINGDGYINTIIYNKENGTKRHVKMHRLIMEKYYGKQPENILVDHKNMIKIDNQKDNLRYCTHKENARNRVRNSEHDTSKYKGVNYRPETKTWRARIMVMGKQVNIGHYKTEIEAAIAYNHMAVIFYDEFARLNKIPDEYDFINPQPIIKPQKKYKGTRELPNGKYSACIKANKKQIYIGTFEIEEDAAKAYDKKAYELHGDKAKLNFPDVEVS